MSDDRSTRCIYCGAYARERRTLSATKGPVAVHPRCAINHRRAVKASEGDDD